MTRFINARLRVFWCLTALLAVGTFQFSGISVGATNAPQTLPYTQAWTVTTQISANDDWAGVPGVIGYLGDIAATSTTNVDPRTLLADYSSLSAVDVIANQSSTAINNGGVAEFDGIANPVVALQGSGTADAPHLIFHLNTTGLSNITFNCNVRDIDATAGEDAVQQVDFQYRVGGTGSYTSIPGGYIADATAAGDTTVTARSLVLPAAANNQANLQIRVMTTNAIGSDEWVGIDNVSVSSVIGDPSDAPVDMNGDGKTDWTVIRNTGGGPTGNVSWFTRINGSATERIDTFGTAQDFFVPADYDGDGSDDIAIWRPGVSLTAGFYIIQSSTGTIRTDAFGQTGDDPTVIGDYNGDGSDDIAVYRAGVTSGDPSTWYYRTAVGGGVFATQWGQNGDFPAPGDYDGDGKNDFVVQRNAGGGQARFWTLSSTGATSSTLFGTPTDVIVPGDYDGDGKTDIAVARGVSGQIMWFTLPSSGGSYTQTPWGNSASDFLTQGDYDGDAKTDIAIWRPNVDTTQNFFYVLGSTSGFQYFEWGQQGDFPAANYNSH